MKTEYDLGECPTNEEWNTYFKCQRYGYAEAVENWLRSNSKEVTQDEFDVLVHRLGDCPWGEDEWSYILYIYEEEIGR